MPSVVHNRQAVRTVIVIAEVRHSFLQSCLPALGWYLVVVCLEMEVVMKKGSEVVYLGLFAFHIIVCPCKEQSADSGVSRLGVTVVPVYGFVEYQSSFLILLFVGTLRA